MRNYIFELFKPKTFSITEASVPSGKFQETTIKRKITREGGLMYSVTIHKPLNFRKHMILFDTLDTIVYNYVGEMTLILDGDLEKCGNISITYGKRTIHRDIKEGLKVFKNYLYDRFVNTDGNVYYSHPLLDTLERVYDEIANDLYHLIEQRTSFQSIIDEITDYVTGSSNKSISDISGEINEFRIKYNKEYKKNYEIKKLDYKAGQGRLKKVLKLAEKENATVAIHEIEDTYELIAVANDAGIKLPKFHVYSGWENPSLIPSSVGDKIIIMSPGLFPMDIPESGVFEGTDIRVIATSKQLPAYIKESSNEE